MIKRTFDIAVSAIGILIAAPFLAAIALAVKVTSRGPVFYRGERVGRNGRPFRIFKFRTMVVNAEALGGSSTPQDDPRITAVGRFLRRYKLDELPQLFNVFNGEMSFVGPRPQVAWAVERYTPEERLLLTVRPGITDLASLNFPNEGEILKGSEDPDKVYWEKIHPEKMRLSLQYVREASLMLDIRIMLRTVVAIFR